ncbi:MAG: hypothetical protein HY336_02735 [Candidatus Doudnabacteria bacterium]|nr:hypothetical protein [Candidatus Doudnabacteria bacterium]
MSHKAQAIVLACIDFRFRKGLQNFLESELGLHDFDLKSDAGGVKQIVEGTPAGEWIAKNFEIAFDLHAVDRVILINHEDCGAYGGSKKFVSSQEEITFQNEQLKSAVSKLKDKYPSKQIEAYLARLSDPIRFEKVV